MPARSVACGMRVAAAMVCIAAGKSANANGARMRPKFVTAAHESQVASDMEWRSCAQRARLYVEMSAPERHVSEASAALCRAMDTPSPVNEGMTAA